MTFGIDVTKTDGGGACLRRFLGEEGGATAIEYRQQRAHQSVPADRRRFRLTSRLIARRDLPGAERVGEPRVGGAGTQRLLLT